MTDDADARDCFGNPRLRFVTPNAPYHGYSVRVPDRHGGHSAWFGRASHGGDIAKAWRAARRFALKYVPAHELRAPGARQVPRPRSGRYMLSGVGLSWRPASHGWAVRAQYLTSDGWRAQMLVLSPDEPPDRRLLIAIRRRLQHNAQQGQPRSRLSAEAWRDIALWHLSWFGQIPRRGLPPLPAGFRFEVDGQMLRASYGGAQRRWYTQGAPEQLREALLLAALWARDEGASLKPRKRKDVLPCDPLA